MSEGLLLPEEEEDKCAPTKEQIEAYLSEPNDAIAESLTEKEKRLVAKAILYGRNIKQAQLAHCFDEIEKIADMEGGPHTFKGESVQDCMLIPKAKWQAWKEVQYGSPERRADRREISDKGEKAR